MITTMTDLCDSILLSMSKNHLSRGRKQRTLQSSPRKQKFNEDETHKPSTSSSPKQVVSKKTITEPSKLHKNSSLQKTSSQNTQKPINSKIPQKIPRMVSEKKEILRGNTSTKVNGIDPKAKKRKIDSSKQVQQNAAKVTLLDDIMQAFEVTKQNLQATKLKGSDSIGDHVEEEIPCSSRQLPPTPVPGSYRPLNQFELSRVDYDHTMVKRFLEKNNLFEKIIGYKMLCGRVEPYYIMKDKMELSNCVEFEYEIVESHDREEFLMDEKMAKVDEKESILPGLSAATGKRGPQTPPGSPRCGDSSHTISSLAEQEDQGPIQNPFKVSNISSTEVSDGGIHVKEGSIEFNLTPIKTERTKSKASPERMDGDNKNSLNIELSNSIYSNLPYNDAMIGGHSNTQFDEVYYSPSPMNISNSTQTECDSIASTDDKGGDAIMDFHHNESSVFCLPPPPPPPPDLLAPQNSRPTLNQTEFYPKVTVKEASYLTTKDPILSTVTTTLTPPTNFSLPPPSLPPQIVPTSHQNATTSGIAVLTANYIPPNMSNNQTQLQLLFNQQSALPITVGSSILNVKQVVSQANQPNFSIPPPQIVSSSSLSMQTQHIPLIPNKSVPPPQIQISNVSIPPPPLSNISLHLLQTRVPVGQLQPEFNYHTYTQPVANILDDNVTMAQSQHNLLAPKNEKPNMPFINFDLIKNRPPPPIPEILKNASVIQKPSIFPLTMSMPNSSTSVQLIASNPSAATNSIPTSSNVFQTMMQALSGKTTRIGD